MNMGEGNRGARRATWRVRSGVYASASLVVAVAVLATAAVAEARDAPPTRYPIVFAHGMGGFDDILGHDYWGNDWGTFVLDPCDKFLETSCNRDIDDDQRSYVSAVQPFESSEVRGVTLADNIESYMATAGVRHVHIVSHSQGGIDARKAARVLRQRLGYRVVDHHVSISSPHRGSPIAKHVLDRYPTQILSVLTNYYGDVVYERGNDTQAALKQLVFDDYDPHDGVTTGMRAFNARYPGGGADVARSRSLMTAQRGSSVNPALWLVSNLIYDIDGDGYCEGDGDGDGASGCGDGRRTDRDDDGLVGINSQQMGYRLSYRECFGCLDFVRLETDHGFVSDLNAPSRLQMTSLSHVINQDHLDVMGVGPDTFDEKEFYAAVTERIAYDGG